MHTPSNRIKPRGELMPPGLFGSTTIDCSACMEKANTRGTTGATAARLAPSRSDLGSATSGLQLDEFAGHIHERRGRLGRSQRRRHHGFYRFKNPMHKLRAEPK